MTDTAAATPPNGGSQPQPQAEGPRLSILTQYVKDLSFENPRAPLGLQPGQPRPEIQIQVDVQARQMGQEQFEVVLELSASARSGETSVFLLELSYGAVFAIANIPAESVQPLLLIECPRLLFPFARRIVSDCTRDGGFPPLMIDPIDFVALYRRRMQQAAEEAAAAAQQGGGETGTA
jgi:preprotein translocase subunit SecB